MANPSGISFRNALNSIGTHFRNHITTNTYISSVPSGVALPALRLTHISSENIPGGFQGLLASGFRGYLVSERIQVDVFARSGSERDTYYDSITKTLMKRANTLIKSGIKDPRIINPVDVPFDNKNPFRYYQKSMDLVFYHLIVVSGLS